MPVFRQYNMVRILLILFALMQQVSRDEWSCHDMLCILDHIKYLPFIVGVEWVFEPLLSGLQEKYQRKLIRKYVDL